MEKIETLKPKVKLLAQQLFDLCKRSSYEIKITEALRSIEEQDVLYAKGRNGNPGEIVTQAKGGESFHNYGLAFDICPIVDGQLAWNRNDLFQIIGDFGISLGLGWGGSWPGSWDKPHFEYTAGYKVGDFVKNVIDWKKFELEDGEGSIALELSGTNISVFAISRSLGYKMVGPDIKLLQQILNKDPETRIAESGEGSPGEETMYFGTFTENALKKFQEKHGIVSNGDPHTTGYGIVGPRTRDKLKDIFNTIDFGK